jgi:type I restriction enzyme S subunit
VSGADATQVGMSRFRPYPEYKGSGVEWLGEIPAHWGIRRLKHLSTVDDEALSEDTDPDLEIVYVDIGNVDASAGIVAKERYSFVDAPSRARRIVRHGDVILSTVRTYLKAIAPIANPEPNLVVSTGFAVVRPKRLDFRFAAYALRAPYFVDRVVANSVGVSYPAINATEMVCFPLACPALDEQRAIAAFLDREMAEIDALLAKKERLIELLQEKRTTLISHAVTKGLDANVRLKDSGAEWLGEIPAHWEVLPLKRLCIRSAIYGANEPAEAYSLEGIRFLRTTDILGDGSISPEGVFLPEELVLDYVLQTGDLLFSRSGTVGRSFVYDRELHGRCAYAGYLVRFVPSGDLHPRYAYYYSKSASFGDWLSVSVISSTIGNVNGQKYANLPVPRPPLPEQRAIAAFLDRETAKIDALAEKVREGIERLKEYRTALISAAVTGKIDVRGVAESEGI